MKTSTKKINPNFYNYFGIKSTITVCVLIFFTGNDEFLEVKFVTVILIRGEWVISSRYLLNISEKSS